MIRLSDITRQMIDDNPLLQFGMYHGLFNLSKLAEFLHPLIEVRAKKEVKKSAIVMTLSRLQKNMSAPDEHKSAFTIENLAINTGLATYTFTKTSSVQDSVAVLLKKMKERGKFLTLTEGTNQVTVIIDNEHAQMLKGAIKEQPVFVRKNLSSIGITFNPEHLHFPGMLALLLQKITLQNINIVEVSSTFTELVIYIDEQDTKLAFQTLYALFARNID